LAAGTCSVIEALEQPDPRPPEQKENPLITEEQLKTRLSVSLSTIPPALLSWPGWRPTGDCHPLTREKHHLHGNATEDAAAIDLYTTTSFVEKFDRR
jgi:hypothetical protein